MPGWLSGGANVSRNGVEVPGMACGIGRGQSDAFPLGTLSAQSYAPAHDPD